MFMRNIGSRRFSTTLSILVNNRNQLKMVNKNNILAAPTQNLLPYFDMGYEYFQSSHTKFTNNFPDLDVFKNKLVANPALANGEDYQDYPLLKILHISLKLIEDGNEDKVKWNKLEQRCSFLLRNTSVSQNAILFFISVHRFSIQFQQQIIKLLEEDLQFLTQPQKQLLFYTMCQLQNKLNQNDISTRLNKLKDTISSTIKNTKLNLTNLIQWIILISIASTSHPYMLIKNLQKLQLYSKYLLTLQQFISLITCIDYRGILVNYQLKQQLMNKGIDVINLFKKTVPNYEMLFNSSHEKVRIKLLLSYYYPGSVEYMLTNQQLLHPNLSPNQSLKYLYWVWKNDYMEQYQLKSLYESIELKSADKSINFEYADIIYYICWLEIGLRCYINYGKVIQLSQKWSYVPRGLEWPLWNYLAQIVKQKVSLTSKQKQSVTVIIHKIQQAQETHNKNKVIQKQVDEMRKMAQNNKVLKFLNSIKLWNFKYCEPVGAVDYISSFVSHDLRVMINCITKSQLIESSNQINNQHIQSKKLLKSNFDYSMIDLNVQEFLSLNYSDRVLKLKNEINSMREIVGKITEQ